MPVYDAFISYSHAKDKPIAAALQLVIQWVDLSTYREGANPRDHSFLDLGAHFAAAIHGMPKEDLLSQEVRQQRRALSLAVSAAGLLLLLVVGAVTAGIIAKFEAERAERNFSAAKSTVDG
jgi:hypothetical protein